MGADAVSGDEGPVNTRPPLLIALAVLLFAEAALLTATFVWLLVELVTTHPASYASAVAIVVLAALAAAWVAVTALKALAARSWTRASAITWQVLQIAVAVGCFQGTFAAPAPALAWALLLPALAGIAFAVSPQVARATAATARTTVTGD